MRDIKAQIELDRVIRNEVFITSVCYSCRQAVHNHGAFDANRHKLARLAIQFGDDIADHDCDRRELDTETCNCRCNRARE